MELATTHKIIGDAMSQRTRLGMLTPSSNTTLEPVSAAMLADLPECSVHFGRFRVTEIALSDKALAQFDPSEILAAAELLSHARCDVIAWNGTSSGWLGFDTDERLCEAITGRTGAKACTSVLALNELFRRDGIVRFALATPYLANVQSAIVANYAKAEVTDAQIRQMVADIAHGPAGQRPQAIAIFCTNLRGAPLAASLEAEFGIPIYDSIATVMWKSLQLAGTDPARAKGWGSWFR